MKIEVCATYFSRCCGKKKRRKQHQRGKVLLIVSVAHSMLAWLLRLGLNRVEASSTVGSLLLGGQGDGDEGRKQPETICCQ